MRSKIIIFDMDGTLVDSEHCAAQAIVDVLPELSLTVEDVIHRYRGMKLSTVISDIAARFRINPGEDVLDKYREREALLSDTMITVNPGVVEVLQTIRQPYCIASNAPREKTLRSLSSCGLRHYFAERIYSAYEVGSWKPEPALFQHAALKEGYPPAQCVVVEDSDTGISAAKAAGMTPIFYNPTNRKTEHGDVASVSAFQQILNFVN